MLEKNTILQGDCLEVLKTIKDKSIDFIFADPPYFMQTTGELLRPSGTKFNGLDEEWDKFKDFKHYDDFCFTWLKECQRILKDNGSICVIGSFQNIYRLGYLMQNLGFWILNDIIWHKSNPVPNFAGTRLCNAHESLIWCAKNQKSKVTFNYKTMKYLNNNKQEKSVWEIPLCIGKERLKDENKEKAHPTQKPEILLEKLLLMATKPNDLVLDPFFGTGTTGAIAKKLGRFFIGIEKESQYIQIATNRIENQKLDLDITALGLLETKPPKVPMKDLIKKGYLQVGQFLYSKNKELQCEILKNGNVLDDEKQELSIHKMSAKILNKINHNGWDYFYVTYKGAFIPLNDLRTIYQKECDAK
ncbi:DNA-methyltransferase [Helicobacter cetorum]|uniref:DNA-methyltransferase n=1 Tax=Helicobacter cetorum TaxID=138563 RepID=UPI000CF14358|nr:site-specific DNA-methyltransferase [Helicobacter cetorum]